MRFTDTLRWILGGLITAVVGLVLMAFNGVKADVQDLQKQVPKNTSDIAVINTEQVEQDKKLDQMKNDLDWLVKRELEHQYNGHTPGDHPKGR